MRVIRSIVRIVNQMSIKYKLFLILLLISIIPISLVNYSSEHFMFRSSIEYSSEISSQYTQFVSREITDYLESLNQSFQGLFIHSDFQRFLDTPAADLAQQANDIVRFRPLITNSLQFHPDVLGVTYLDTLGKTYFYSNQKTLDASFSFSADSLYSGIFEMAEPALLPSHPMSYVLYAKDPVFSYVWPIVNLNTGDTRSWLIIEIKEEKLTSMLGNRPDAIGQLSLYHGPSGSLIAEDPMSPGLTEDFRLALSESPSGERHFLFESGGASYEASYAVLPVGDWLLVWTASLSSIARGAQQAFLLTLLITAVSLAIALFIAFPVMNRVLNPLFRLKQGMQNLGRGVYTPIPASPRQDEIGYLVRSYNHTLDKLQTMEREVFQSKLKEKEREVLQLQAQINPHFLFNTLETIDSYASRNNGDAVSEMVLSVSRMMRHTVSHNSGWTTVREEMDYIRHFMRIHYFRHGQEVNSRFELDDDAMGERIMKLSIQPYIENAFKYGWSPNMSASQFRLSVSASVQGSRLVVTVEDTGAGMPADTLARLKRLIEAKGDASDPFFRRHTGIQNAYRRFFLMYGDAGSLRIDSEPGTGTRVEMVIPRLPPLDEG
ncbi:sensor histidine kinase [Paenibacillaceae bacterium WGS1546]|uniref:cache domain-containing sensor histidine kinase n=1 Tax=Cohnella sp. WGS1546 TaxID=3366810 RepID=UPI00372D815D